MNTTELIAEVKRLWLGPSSALLQTTDDDILGHANRVIEEEIMPRLIDLQENYLVREERITITSGTTKYRLPKRSFNTQLVDVIWRQSAGQQPIPVNWIDRQDRNYYPSSSKPGDCYLEGDYIVLYGDPGGILEIGFSFRPGKLVTADNWRTIATVTPATKTITLTSTAPSGWSTSSTFDIHSALSSHEIEQWDLTASTVSGTTITFNEEIDTTVFGRHLPAAGDYVCLAEKAAAPMLPQGLHGVVVRGTVVRIAESQTDTEYYKLAKAEYVQNFQSQMKNLDRRVTQKKVLINQNSRFRRWGAGFGRGRRRFI